MFYVLNFDTHEFISCHDANAAEANIRSLLTKSGCSEDSLEVINGFAEECRFGVSEFRSYCKSLELTDEHLVGALMQAEHDKLYRGYQSAYGDVDFPQFPYDFGNGYKVQTLYSNLLDPSYVNVLGDIFDDLSDAEEEYPEDEIVVGFSVVFTLGGEVYTPDGVDPFTFCKSVDEAIELYREKVLPTLPAVVSKPTLVDQAQSASTRAAESLSAERSLVKRASPER